MTEKLLKATLNPNKQQQQQEIFTKIYLQEKWLLQYKEIRKETDLQKISRENECYGQNAKNNCRKISYRNDPKFRTDRPGQTVQTQSSLIRVYTVCNSLCIFWTHFSKVKPLC